MKKKIVTLSLVVAMAATALIGGTLAYFVDNDKATNVFTVGDVDITLDEVFDEDDANLMPGKENAVNKDVWVSNKGESDAYVRVKVYIPSALDQLTTPDYTEDGYLVAAAFNTLHMNTAKDADTYWEIEKANVEAKAITDKSNEYYGYNEYVFYYRNKLEAGKQTAQLLDQFYLDKKLDVDVITDKDGNKTYEWSQGEIGVAYAFEEGIEIPVIAEAIQADGFKNYTEAFEAYDAQLNN